MKGGPAGLAADRGEFWERFNSLPKNPKMKSMTSIFLIAITVYLVAVALMYFFQRSFLYHPSSGLMEPGHFGESRMSVVKVVTDDGLPLISWYRKAAEGKPTILYFPGNAGHIGHRIDKIQGYLEAGYGVFLLSYRGFGSNPGFPTEEGLYLDGKAAMDYLKSENVPYFRLVLYGESLGTGIAVELAQDRGIAALILEAPFTSINDVAQHHFWFFPARYMIKDSYNSLSKINRVNAPILFIHGELDRTIPVEFGRRLFMAAPKQKHMILVPDAGHNNLYDFGVDEKVIDFIDRAANESGS